MINALQSELTINVVASIIVSLLFLGLGFLWGKYKERRRKFGRNLEEYDFYPFTVTRENFGEFSQKDFRLGMHYFLKNEDHTAARQLIFIGERKFKCTTIPIKRQGFGIVGAICINIDANYITEEVLKDRQRIETWFQNFLRTDMQLDENILSKDEYAKALKGKRHFKDEAF